MVLLYSLSEREKSATKEVMSILGKVLLPLGEKKAEVLKSSDASKRQKLCAQETGEDEGKTVPLDADALQETGNF